MVCRSAEGVEEFMARAEASKPREYLSNGDVVDYAITEIEKYSGLEEKLHDSICLLFDSIMMQERSSVGIGNDKASEEIKASILKQEELVKSFKAEAESYRAAAEIIQQNMARINMLIAYLQSCRRATLKEIRDSFPAITIKNLNLKDKTVSIEVS